MVNEKEIIPPWQKYLRTDPTWAGWRQGTSEYWLLEVRFPFWRDISDIERADYLRRWPPPDELWRLYLLTYWT